ncbi:MAG: peptidylprolyl isomerase [Acaryochloris sp. RU_4_1]|nr:peptidylprolyl isomerase [Acaryochloris sp. SU_5_25]NJM67253.1 peptidylprolyl isomerase [Acaryochloris sp. RU_4_1]NJN39286.1 peptidylprolyl isomerase [Acaryochloridaceae cyanobacterium CSU_3_4]NJR56183.1 peptidylprolyl isomerase [Acaryochloris sp. CRU_2_0]
MANVLQVGSQEFTAAEVMPLLVNYGLLPQFLREVVIDQAIAAVSCDADEVVLAQEQFAARYRLTTPEAVQSWAASQGMTIEQVTSPSIRALRLAKFKQATWGNRVGSYFLKIKPDLDQVVYSVLRTQNRGLAQELYFRIQAGEQSFAELARTYSQGPEAHTNGLLGPVELKLCHPVLKPLLMTCQPGQLRPPTRLEEWFVILRLEQRIPAQLNDALRQRLLDDLFETWLREQIIQLQPRLVPDSLSIPVSA